MCGMFVLQPVYIEYIFSNKFLLITLSTTMTFVELSRKHVIDIFEDQMSDIYWLKTLNCVFFTFHLLFFEAY